MVSMKSVKDTIGIPNPNSLSRLCALPEKGGSGGYAYYVKENSRTSSGNLVENSLPYHNIYSRNSPAEWVSLGPSDYVRNRLKRDSADHYHYSLGEFSSYNHNSSAPTHVNAKASSAISESSHYMKGNFNASLGSIDWRIYNLDKSLKASKVKLIVYSSIHDFSLECGSSTFIDLKGQNDITFVDTEYYIDASSAGTRDYKTRIALYSSNGTKMGYIPGNGIIKITVLGKPKEGELRIQTKVNGQWISEIYLVKTGSTIVNLSANLILAEFTYQWLYDSDPPVTRYLDSALYEAVDRDTELVKFSSEVNGILNTDGFFPKKLYKDPTSSIIYAPTNYLTPGPTLYLRVTLYYK